MKIACGGKLVSYKANNGSWRGWQWWVRQGGGGWWGGWLISEGAIEDWVLVEDAKGA